MENQEKREMMIDAFPNESHNASCRGMTLRDYFAAKAMNGLISNPNYGIFDGKNEVHTDTIKQCYNIADAMLKERENETSK